MPKYDSVEDYLRTKLEGQRERCGELQGKIWELQGTIVKGVDQFQTLNMRHERSRTEIGLLRKKVKDLQEQLDGWEREH